jgi:group II intron reverse transcriptase/maturase
MARATKLDTVRELQRTLYRAAKADPGRRFHALYDKVYRRDVLERAWELVRANKGAAGVDQQTIADVEEYGVAKLLDELTADLKQGRWRPLAARRVYIPKRGRPTEQRPLSIPAVRDRVVQAAARLVIEPIFEADFLPCSFGFRPRRSQHDALQVMIDESWRGRRWAAESDISNCFGEIPHSGLMSAIEERISDRNLLKLLRAMLRAGVMEGGAVHREAAGTPQGGVISPCLCNVYLHRLDRQWDERGTGVLVRFADDLLVLCHNRREAEDALEALRLILAEMGLQLKQAKTRIVHLKEGGEGLISSVSTIVGCAASVAMSICGSSLAGPHARRCSEPATGSVSSRSANEHCCRSKRSCTTSTTSCAAGRTTTAMGTVALLSPRSEPTRCSDWFCSWLTGTTAQRGMAGRS